MNTFKSAGVAVAICLCAIGFMGLVVTFTSSSSLAQVMGGILVSAIMIAVGLVMTGQMSQALPKRHYSIGIDAGFALVTALCLLNGAWGWTILWLIFTVVSVRETYRDWPEMAKSTA